MYCWTRPALASGTLREHPEIRWRIDPNDFVRIATLQGRMLERAAELLRPGGAIVYSVCSVAPEEGQSVVDAFLRRHRDFVVDPAPASDQ